MSELDRAIRADTKTFLPEHVPPFEAVLARKSARDRRRRTSTGALAVAAVALAGAVVFPLAVGSSQERLAPAAAGPDGSPVGLAALRATATAEIVEQDGPSRLTVKAGGGPVPLATGRDVAAPEGLHLTFSAPAGEHESFWPYPVWSARATADEGPGVLGISGVCGRGWKPDGAPAADDPCQGAMQIVRTGPGPVRVPLVLYPRVGDDRALPGTYQTELDLQDGGTLRITVHVSERPPPVDAAPGTSEELGGLAPPAAAERLVLCSKPFGDDPLTGRADCALVDDPGTSDHVRSALATAEQVPTPTHFCAIGAGVWDVVWLGRDGAVADRVSVPDATCLTAARADGIQHSVPERLLDTLRTVHAAQARAGGAFDGLADPNPPAALCAFRYPNDLPARTIAFDGVVLAISDTDPADAPESPGVPFSDVELLVLNTYTGQPAGRVVVRALIGRPDPERVLGERLLVATDDPLFLGACGFTQPYSAYTAADWTDAFD